METAEFDAALGGTENLPQSANNLKFAASRSIEIAAMTESILRPSNTKLIFQSLPVHMRRRVMSHNCKRLPKKLREGHLEQLKKSGLPPKQKRPSRKYRRRPANLLEEYKRRQIRKAWLETHIWHAKRFHMIERWNHKLPYAPCDKAFRACYRASSAHCLMQDISYYVPIKITGTVGDIREMFSCLTDSSNGLGICAKCYTTGNREGAVNLYHMNKFPYGFIGKIYFNWVPCHYTDRTLWLFVHPSQVQEVESVLTHILCMDIHTSNPNSEKRRKLTKLADSIELKLLPGAFNRFRLTGPKSHAVLAKTLNCVKHIKQINKTNEWVKSLDQDTELCLEEKLKYWENICKVNSPAQLPPKLTIGLVVRDPRLSRPAKRTKTVPDNSGDFKIEVLMDFPKLISTSPLWDTSTHKTIEAHRMTTAQFMKHTSHLVPGELDIEDPEVQSVPVILIQRPGSQESVYKKLGYGSGWDIIVPSGYGLPFWHAFVMFGGRSGGLRETESLAFETGECYLPPDSNAGIAEEKIVECELKGRYFKLPPSKRVNYTKLGVISPFICPWKILLTDWSEKSVDNYFVLRDKILLETIQICVTEKKSLPSVEHAANCLIAVYVKTKSKGNLKRYALICLPEPSDTYNIKNLLEPHHKDTNEEVRKQTKVAHNKNLKRWRRKRVKRKKNGKLDIDGQVKITSQGTKPASEYEKTMKELWLSSDVQNIRHSCSREILGYLAQGAFSFTEARNCGVGYVPYNALNHLLNSGNNEVLVRNPTSRKYRMADFTIIQTI